MARCAKNLDYVYSIRLAIVRGVYQSVGLAMCPVQARRA